MSGEVRTFTAGRGASSLRPIFCALAMPHTCLGRGGAVHGTLSCMKITSHGLSQPVHIRVAKPAEVMAAIPLVNDAFAVEDFFQGPRTDVAEMKKRLSTGTFLIAKHDAMDHPVALVYVETKAPRGYFGMLSVDPSRQGTGLGRRMVEAAEEFCRRAGCTHLDIHVLNLRTELQPFYRKLGYIETGTAELHPVSGLKPGLKCHIIVMSKAL